MRIVFILVGIIVGYTISLFLGRTNDFQDQGLYFRNAGNAEKFLDSGEWELAALQFEKDVQMNSGHSDSHLQLAILYEDYLDQPEKAIQHYESFLRIFPQTEKSELVRSWLGALKKIPTEKKLKDSMDYERVIDDLEKEQAVHEAKIKNLRNELDNRDIELDRMKKDLESKKQKNIQMEEDIRKLREQMVVQKIPKSDPTEERVMSLESKIKDMEKDLTEKKTSLSGLTELYDQAKVAGEKLSLEVESLKVENHQLKSSLESNQQSIRSQGMAHKRSSELLKENKELSDRIKTLEAKSIRYYAAIQSLRSTNSNLKRQVAILKQYRPEKLKTYTRKYKVKQGESLRTIATLFYGNKDKWVLIYNANRKQIQDPDILTPGQVLVIPQDSRP